MYVRRNLSPSERFYILSRDEFTCQYCGKKVPDVVLHVDHIIPIARGGEDNVVNLIASCSGCNQGKSAGLLPDTLITNIQKDVLRRTLEYDLHLKTVPIMNSSSQKSHLLDKPSDVLNKFPKIFVPLKNRVVHPNKRHVLEVIIYDEMNLKTSYSREYNGNWEEVESEADGFIPFTYDEYNAISNQLGDVVDVEKIQLPHASVTVTSYNKGFHTIQVNIEHYSYLFCLWTPVKELEIYISPKLDYPNPGVSTEEDLFYSIDTNW